MAYEAAEIGGAFHSGLGALAGVATLAMLDGRANAAQRAARRARSTAAAHAGRARVLRGTVTELRERLEDSFEDLDDAEDRIQALLDQVAKLTADRLTLANALRARAA